MSQVTPQVPPAPEHLADRPPTGPAAAASTSAHVAPADMSPAANAPSADDVEARLRACETELARVLRDQALVSYGIAHDLRAPLRAIDGFAAMLEAGSGNALDESGRNHLARIRAAAARMGALMDALQALSHASHDPLEIGDVDASLLADWSLMELRDAHPGRDLQADVQPGIRVRGDERLLKQLFEVLLHNAWTFTPADAAVRITVTATQDGDRVRIHVRDHGRGFDPEHAERAFEPFQRLHSAEEGGGHGLGLAIARRIVSRHGGRIAVDAIAGSGCTFHVELPAAGGAAP